MKLGVTSAKLTGDTSDSDWVQVHDFRPEGEEKFNNKGHLFAVFSAKIDKSGIDKVVVGREIITRLHEEYFGKVDSGAFSALAQAVDKVSKEFLESLGKVEIAAVAVVRETVYSAAVGGAQVSILRNAMLADILVSNKGVASASGHPNGEDVLILGTRAFFDNYSDGQIKAALQGKSADAAVEALAPSAHSADDSGKIAAAILKFSEEPKFKIRETEGQTTDLKVAGGTKKGFGIVGRAKKSFKRLGEKLPEKQIKVREHSLDEAQTGGKRKVAASVGIILLLLLSVSIFFGVKQKEKKDFESSYKTRLTESKFKFEEAVGLFEIDPKRARELFSESKKTVDGLIGEGIDAQEVLELSQSINESMGMILGEYKVDPEMFLDLSLLSDGFSGKDLAASAEKIYVLDQQGEKAVSIDFQTKRSEVTVGPDQLDGADKLAAYAERIFVIESGEIYEVSENEKDSIEKLGASEILIKAYAGNLYALEKSLSSIWRIPGTDEGFASKKNWLAEGVEPDFSRIVSWAIDGTIWLLSESGKVSRYSLGNQINFEVSGVFPPITSATDLYTNDRLQFVYLLESESGRVVVIDKKGGYIAQYISEDIKEAKKIVVSEKEKKMILLTGQKLLAVEIKHLD